MLHLLKALYLWIASACRYLIIGPPKPQPGRKFTDVFGKDWRVHITVPLVSQVHRETGVMLTSIFSDNLQLLSELSTNLEKLVQVLWVVCEQQSESRGVSPEQFAESLGGDALGDAREALVRATIDFFTSPDQRAAAHLMLDKINETASKFTGETSRTIQRLDADQLAESCLSFAMNGQESPESTRQSLHSANSV